MSQELNRRSFLKTGALAGAAMTGVATSVTPAVAAAPKKYQKGVSQWPICLNSSTIRPTPLTEKIKIAEAAGFDAIEPWIGELQTYEKEGGDLKALGKEIKDRGLYIPNIIGLWNV